MTTKLLEEVRYALDSVMPMSEENIGDLRVIERQYSKDTSKCTIGLAQIQQSVPGIKENKDKIEKVLQVFKDKKVNIAVFPEFSVTGYFWSNSKECFKYMDKGAIDEHADWVNSTLIGMLDSDLQFIILNNPRRGPGKKYFNSTYVIAKGHDWLKSENNYDKIFIPGIEKDYTETGSDDHLVVDTKWGVLGFTTCYDYCFSQLIQEYSLIEKVDAIIECAAWSGGGTREYPGMNVLNDTYYTWYWDTIMAARSCTHNIWTISCNASGVHPISNVMFLGGSGIWAPSGLPLIQGSKNKSIDELVIIHNVDLKGEVQNEIRSSDRIIDFNQIYRPLKGKRCFTRIY